jgi:hypothetical protein
MDTVGIRVPTRQIIEFSAFSVSSEQIHSLSARYFIAANDIRRFLDICSKSLSLLRTISLHGKGSRVVICFSLIWF